MKTYLQIGAAAFLIASCPVAAQQERVGQSEAEPGAASESSAPIVVVGSAAEPEKQVVVGSRIPRKPLFTDGPVATSTGTPGFTPGSGMDPFAGATRKRAKRECRSDNPAISQAAACILAAADKAAEAGDAASLLRGMLSDSGSSADEKLAAAERLYLLAGRGNDDDLRAEALEMLAQNPRLSAAKRAEAWRALAGAALAAQAVPAAIARLEEALALDPDHAQSWANLAQLRRQEGTGDWRGAMQRAIAVREAAGEPVEAGWRDFVR